MNKIRVLRNGFCYIKDVLQYGEVDLSNAFIDYLVSKKLFLKDVLILLDTPVQKNGLWIKKSVLSFFDYDFEFGLPVELDNKYELKIDGEKSRDLKGHFVIIKPNKQFYLSKVISKKEGYITCRFGVYKHLKNNRFDMIEKFRIP